MSNDATRLQLGLEPFGEEQNHVWWGLNQKVGQLPIFERVLTANLTPKGDIDAALQDQEAARIKIEVAMREKRQAQVPNPSPKQKLSVAPASAQARNLDLCT